MEEKGKNLKGRRGGEGKRREKKGLGKNLKGGLVLGKGGREREEEGDCR